MGQVCVSCHDDFIPRFNIHGQRFCGKKECQRKRRAQWQRKKLLEDADYREHQKKARENWRGEHRDYMRAYRRTHPAYRERDRQQRRERRKRTREVADIPGAVKMDAWTSDAAATPIESGYFRICRVYGAQDGGAVKMDACPWGSLVQLVVVQEDRRRPHAHDGAP